MLEEPPHLAPPLPEAPHGTTGWRACLRLELAQVVDRTRIIERAHRGPLQVQRAFYPEVDGTCHVYLLHPPGGLVHGDTLDIDIAVRTGARALLTTPAATKVYRSAGRTAALNHCLRVARGGWLEWLPQENILYRGARLQSSTRVDLEHGAGFAGWELSCFGRPACAERFSEGSLAQSFELWEDGRPLWIERNRVTPTSGVLDARWGYAGFPVGGTFVCRYHEPGLPEALSALSRASADVSFSVSLLRGVVVCRYLGQATEPGRQLFTQAWELLRPLVSGRLATAPRIWKT